MNGNDLLSYKMVVKSFQQLADARRVALWAHCCRAEDPCGCAPAARTMRDWPAAHLC